MIRDLGVLRNHIGSEALSATVKYIPAQLTKRMLGSKTTRVKYIETIIMDPQRPFIRESFHPGTIPLASERSYYDGVWLVFWARGTTHWNLGRNGRVHSNQYPCCEHFLSITAPTASSPLSHPLILVKTAVQLVHWLSQLQL